MFNEFLIIYYISRIWYYRCINI